MKPKICSIKEILEEVRVLGNDFLILNIARVERIVHSFLFLHKGR